MALAEIEDQRHFPGRSTLSEYYSDKRESALSFRYLSLANLSERVPNWKVDSAETRDKCYVVEGSAAR